METLITKPAPDFIAKAVMPDGSFANISLSDYRGKYVILFFYPLDFSFVCPIEMVELNEKLDEFKKRNAEVITVSVDSEYSHFAWRNIPPSKGGIGNVGFPMVADITKEIAQKYGVLLDNAVALRALFLIDKEGIIRHAVINDVTLVRNIDEAIRMLDALQYFEQNGEVCPVDWHKGEKGVEPTFEGVSNYLKQKVEER